MDHNKQVMNLRTIRIVLCYDRGPAHACIIQQTTHTGCERAVQQQQQTDHRVIMCLYLYIIVILTAAGAAFSATVTTIVVRIQSTMLY